MLFSGVLPFELALPSQNIKHKSAYSRRSAARLLSKLFSATVCRVQGIVTVMNILFRGIPFELMAASRAPPIDSSLWWPEVTRKWR